MERHPDGPRPFRFTRPELYALNDAGFFRTTRVELIHGVILEARTVANPPHRTAVRKTTKALERAFPTGVDVRPEGELDLGLDTEPQPDVAVVTGSIEDYATKHPTTALLVVEVSDTTLFRDLTEKAELYAAAGITDYWVVDLPKRQVHVLRDPAPVASNGHSYRDQRVLGPADVVSPLAAPLAIIPVAELLP
ncbi:MAG: Uma2 family endonuclease [Gemmataceae bacterium]|nr:Uma2 family endonuclease [Gemmataceae bacterium]